MNLDRPVLIGSGYGVGTVKVRQDVVEQIGYPGLDATKD